MLGFQAIILLIQELRHMVFYVSFTSKLPSKYRHSLVFHAESTKIGTGVPIIMTPPTPLPLKPIQGIAMRFQQSWPESPFCLCTIHHSAAPARIMMHPGTNIAPTRSSHRGSRLPSNLHLSLPLFFPETARWAIIFTPAAGACTHDHTGKSGVVWGGPPP